MSLTEPTFIEKYIAPYKTWWIVGGLAVVLIFASIVLYQSGETYFENRRIGKMKANANAALQDAVNIKQSIVNDEKRLVEANANVNAAVSELKQATFGLDAAKQETNAALANFNKALASNSSEVNRTAEDLQRQLERLGNQ